MRPSLKGPRSLTRTRTVFPFERFSTSTHVSKGSDLCAAVIARMSKVSPLAVSLPW